MREEIRAGMVLSQKAFHLESTVSLIPGELWSINNITELVSP